MATNLSTANDFNIYVLRNHTANSTDAEGRVAVAGNATYVNYGVGDALSVSTTRPDLVVGKVINITGGTNFSGNTTIAPGGVVVGYTMTNNNGVKSQPATSAPIDFTATSNYLLCASLNWGALTATGKVTLANGGLTLEGTDKALNIFTFDGTNIAGSGTALGSINGLNIIAPEGSTVLVNIFGDTVSFGSFQIFRNGQAATGEDGRYILWNLPQTTTLMPNTTSIKGSLLAPNATYMAGYSNVEGTIAVLDLTGFVEAHNYLFAGKLPDVCGNPDPLSTTVSKTTSTTTSTTSSTTSTSTTSTASSTTSTSTTSTASSTTSTSTTSTASSTTSTSTTSTSTTTSATSTASTTTACMRLQAVTDVFESIALVQTALSHILNVEGEKIQKALTMDLDVTRLLDINDSVKDMIHTVSLLESILIQKAEILQDGKVDGCTIAAG